MAAVLWGVMARLAPIGDVLRRARKEGGFTQEELAARACVDRKQLALYEANRTQPRMDTFIRLARALEVNPSELLAQAESWPQGLDGRDVH